MNNKNNLVGCLVCEKNFEQPLNIVYSHIRCCNIHWHYDRAKFAKYIKGVLYIFTYYFNTSLLIGVHHSNAKQKLEFSNIKIDFKNIDTFFHKIIKLLSFY